MAGTLSQQCAVFPFFMPGPEGAGIKGGETDKRIAEKPLGRAN